MCGIAGVFSTKPVDGLNNRITAMNNSIEHRGPEAGNVMLYNDQTAFGHRRLKIIDLSDEANQPMNSSCGKYSIIFNGEIYNYNELKGELNYEFKTTCDTEVILAAVSEHGYEWFVSKANGMFGIAIYDHDMDEVILARDRFGIKPLYYTVDDLT